EYSDEVEIFPIYLPQYLYTNINIKIYNVLKETNNKLLTILKIYFLDSEQSDECIDSTMKCVFLFLFCICVHTTLYSITN
ncbi:hypothetical protein FWK35_00035772, partial [Aphis craccivora]